MLPPGDIAIPASLDVQVEKPPNGSIICLLGIDGSGKSRLLTEVARVLPTAETIAWNRFDALVDIPGVTTGEHLAHVLPRLPAYARASLLLHIIALESDWASRASAAGRQPIIIDSYWYKFAAKEVALAASPPFFLEALMTFPAPDAIVFLDTPPAVAYDRKVEFTPYEGGSTRADFLEFQSASRTEMLRLIDGLPCTIMDGTRSVAALTEEFLGVCERLSRRSLPRIEPVVDADPTTT